MASSAAIASTATAIATPARVLAVLARQTATAGTVVLKDGGAGGATMLTMYTAASATAVVVLPIPGGGITFATDVYAAMTNVDGLTLIYDTP